MAESKFITNEIIEQGTATGAVYTGIGQAMTWHYVKWANGLAMCFGDAVSTRSSTGTGNALYYGSGADPAWTFPSGLFISDPVLNVTISNFDGDDKWVWAVCGSHNNQDNRKTNKDHTCRITPVSFASYSCTFHISLVAWGFWK